MIIVQISNHLSARNFSPNFGAICTARYPMNLNGQLKKKVPGVENVEILPDRHFLRGLRQEHYFFVSFPLLPCEKTTFEGHSAFVNNG